MPVPQASPDPDPGRMSSSERSGTVAEVAAMCVLAFLPMLLLAVSQSAALRVLAIASIVLGLAVFYLHGGIKVTAAGLFCGTAGLMNGSGGWYWSSHVPPYATAHAVLLACITVFTTTTLLYALFWHRSVPSETTQTNRGPNRPTIDASVTNALTVIGLVLFVFGALLHRVHQAFGTLDIAAADVGVIVLGGAVMLGGGGLLRRSPFRAVMVGVVLLAYYLLVFSGGGRLRLITIAAGLAIVAQYRLRTPLKKLALLLIIPGVLLFGAIGQQRVAQRNLDSTYQASASGLGSLVNPLETYGELISGHLNQSHGSTLVAEAVVLVPRKVWPGKPQQFSREVALTLRPTAVQDEPVHALPAPGRVVLQLRLARAGADGAPAGPGHPLGRPPHPGPAATRHHQRLGGDEPGDLRRHGRQHQRPRLGWHGHLDHPQRPAPAVADPDRPRRSDPEPAQAGGRCDFRQHRQLRRGGHPHTRSAHPYHRRIGCRGRGGSDDASSGRRSHRSTPQKSPGLRSPPSVGTCSTAPSTVRRSPRSRSPTPAGSTAPRPRHCPDARASDAAGGQWRPSSTRRCPACRTS